MCLTLCVSSTLRTKLGTRVGTQWIFVDWSIKQIAGFLSDSLDSKEIKPVHPQWNQPWILIGRTIAEAEAPILWPPDAKNLLIGKDSGAGKDWRQEEKGMTEDEMVGWHHQLNVHEFDQTPGDGEGQGSLACCSPWDHKESDMTEQLNNTSVQTGLPRKFLPALPKARALLKNAISFIYSFVVYNSKGFQCQVLLAYYLIDRHFIGSAKKVIMRPCNCTLCKVCKWSSSMCFCPESISFGLWSLLLGFSWSLL